MIFGRSIKSPTIKTLLPILSWLPGYKKSWLAGDVSAGITVGVMLIPQGMAYSMLAGLDPIHGLYAVTIPLFIYALFGTSRQLAVGPVAMVSLLTAAGIGSLNPSGADEYLLYAITLAFMVGVIQFGLGILRMGFVVHFLSHPVISGFTSAAAIIIGLSQLKHLLGVDLPRSEHLQDIAAAVYQNIGDTHLITFGIGIAAILTIKFGKKIHNAFPAALAAVIVGIAVVSLFDLNNAGVSVTGNVPGGLPSLSVPAFDGESWSALLPIALAISLVGFAESYAVAKAIHAKHKNYKLDADQELVGLGLANFGAAFFKGFPVTGGFSRTAVNDQAGAKTGLASIISSILIGITLLFMTGLFENLPNAVLAAVVIVAVSGLININEPVELWKKDKTDFALLMITFSGTLTLGIEIGILGGMGLSLINVVYRASRPHMAQLGRIPGTNTFRNISRFDHLDVPEGVLIVRIDGPVYFANMEYVLNKIDAMIKARTDQLELIVLDFESVTHIDSSSVRGLKDRIQDMHKSKLTVCIASPKGPVRDILDKWNIISLCGRENIFLEVSQPVDAFLNDPEMRNTAALTHYSLQSNATSKK